MSRMNTMIPLGIEAPDFVGAMNRGALAGAQRNDIDQTNALRNFMAQSGGDVFAGDQNALRQYAQFNPEAAYDMQAAQADAARRDQLFQMEQQRFGMEQQRFAAESAPDQDAYMSEVVNGLGYYFSQGDEAGYYAALESVGIDPADMPIEVFPMIAAQFDVQVEAPDQMANGFDPDRYRNVEGVGLVDLQAEGGPAPVQFGGGAVQPAGITQDQLGDANTLRDDLRTDLGNFALAREGWDGVQTFFQNPGAVSDRALAIAFAKILDPTSVVRESESAAIANSGSLSAGLKAQLQNAIEGSGGLPPEVRQEIAALSVQLYNNQAERASGVLQSYQGIAEQAGIPRNAIYTQDQILSGKVPEQNPARPKDGGRAQSQGASVNIATPPPVFLSSPEIAQAAQTLGITPEQFWERLDDEGRAAWAN